MTYNLDFLLAFSVLRKIIKWFREEPNQRHFNIEMYHDKNDQRITWKNHEKDLILGPFAEMSPRPLESTPSDGDIY